MNFNMMEVILVLIIYLTGAITGIIIGNQEDDDGIQKH